MTNELREKIERWTILAESLLKTNTRAFLVDTNDTYHWCDIIFVGEDTITIQPFKGINAGINRRFFWADVVKFEEYQEGGA